MPRPLCVRCQVEYRAKKNDVVVEEMASFGSYKLWCADLWECPMCQHKMITGYGRDAYAEHWQDEYPQKVKNAREHGLYRCFEFNEAIGREESEQMQERIERAAGCVCTVEDIVNARETLRVQKVD